jgi:hypothetical protein
VATVECLHNAALIAAAPETAAERDRLRHVNAELLAALTRLTEKTERANAIQHSGGRLLAEDWSELYQLSNDARAAIQKAEGR